MKMMLKKETFKAFERAIGNALRHRPEKVRAKNKKTQDPETEDAE